MGIEKLSQYRIYKNLRKLIIKRKVIQRLKKINQYFVIKLFNIEKNLNKIGSNRQVFP